MADLETQLKESANFKLRMIATDGVFSMDGDIAKLKEICDLAEKHEALMMVDDSHATGFLGKNGRGSAEFCGVEGRVDVLLSQYAGFISEPCKGYLRAGGVLVANNSHGDARLPARTQPGRRLHEIRVRLRVPQEGTIVPTTPS